MTTRSRADQSDNLILGCQAFSLLLVLAFWAGVAFVAWHFLGKYW